MHNMQDGRKLLPEFLGEEVVHLIENHSDIPKQTLLNKCQPTQSSQLIRANLLKPIHPFQHYKVNLLHTANFT